MGCDGDYDLVLMDCQVPKVDGRTATQRIQAQLAGSAPPIIALTADGTARVRSACFEAGMDDFLTKPLRRAELAATLRQVAARPGCRSRGRLSAFSEGRPTPSRSTGVGRDSQAKRVACGVCWGRDLPVACQACCNDRVSSSPRACVRWRCPRGASPRRPRHHRPTRARSRHHRPTRSRHRCSPMGRHRSRRSHRQKHRQTPTGRRHRSPMCPCPRPPSHRRPRPPQHLWRPRLHRRRFHLRRFHPRRSPLRRCPPRRQPRCQRPRPATHPPDEGRTPTTASG